MFIVDYCNNVSKHLLCFIKRKYIISTSLFLHYEVVLLVGSRGSQRSVEANQTCLPSNSFPMYLYLYVYLHLNLHLYLAN